MKEEIIKLRSKIFFFSLLFLAFLSFWVFLTLFRNRFPGTIIDSSQLFACLFLLFPYLVVLMSLWNILREYDFLSRLILLFLPLATFSIGLYLTYELLTSPFQLWNGAFLAPSRALLSGHSVYPGLNSGPLQPYIYGPIAVISYIPAVAFAQTPTLAVILGVLTTMFFYFVPPFFTFLYFSRHLHHRVVYAFAASVCFFLLTCLHESLTQTSFVSRPDAPALGLCVLASLIVVMQLEKEDSQEKSAYIFSSALALLAVWCKQTVVSIVFVLPLFLWMASGKGKALRYVKYLFWSGVITSTFFLVAFGAKNLIFTMFVLPSQIGWWTDFLPGASIGKLKQITSALRELLIFSLPSLLLLSAAFGFKFLEFRQNGTSILRRVICSPRGIFLLISISMVPTALLGRVKWGGDLNTFSTVLYFLTLSVPLAFLGLLNIKTVSKDALSADAAKVMFLSATLAICFFMVILLHKLSEMIPLVMKNDHEIAYQIAKAHPGEIYFPHHPLSSLFAEDGAYYHHSYGIRDRYYAFQTVSDEHVQKYLPPKMKYVMMKNPEPDDAIFHFLKNYSKSTRFQLPNGWVVFEKHDHMESGSHG